MRQRIGSIGVIEESHHLEPIYYRRLLLEKLTPQILLPILQPLQLIREHLRIDGLPLGIDLPHLPLQHLHHLPPCAPATQLAQDRSSPRQDQMSVPHMVGQLRLDHLQGQSNPLDHQLVLVPHPRVLVLRGNRLSNLLLLHVDRLGVGGKHIARVADGGRKSWRVKNLLRRAKVNGNGYRWNVDRLWAVRYGYLLLVACTVGAEISVFLEVRLVVALDLADSLDGLQGLLPLL